MSNIARTVRLIRANQSLRLKGNQWQFFRRVPEDISEALGRSYVVVNLRTGNITEARRRRDQLLTETDNLFKRAKQGLHAVHDQLQAEADAWREQLQQVEDMHEQATLELVLSDEAERVEAKNGFAAAKAFYDHASGQATAITDAQVERFNNETGGVATTKVGRKAAVRDLKAWLGATRSCFERVDRRTAGDYISQELITKRQLMPKSVNSQVSFLSSFWRWAAQRGLAQENVWLNQSLSIPRKRVEGLQKRIYWTDEEVLKLIRNAPTAALKDAIQMAVLSGLRVSELADMRAEHVDLKTMTLRVVASKTPAGIRTIPIHSQLQEVFKRRCKNNNGFVFNEIGNRRQRAKGLVNRFSPYKNTLFPELRAKTTHKQTEKTFHSLRHTFIDARLKAGVQLWIVQRCVGHEPTEGGVTTSVYGREASLEQLRECVEAVRLKL